MGLVSEIYWLLAVIALATSLATTAAARWVALRTGVLDRPDGARKLHGNATPLMGGIAIYASLLVTIGIARWIPTSAYLMDRQHNLSLEMLLLSGGLFCLLGLYDDIRPMRPLHKFVCQFLAALPFAIWGPPVSGIEIIAIPISFGTIVGTFLTCLWLVTCVNIINLIDGLDGLAGTVGLIACIGIAFVADYRLSTGAAVIAVIVSGSLSGFLCHNLPPARIFLGDSGSLLIGFLIGALSIVGSLKTATGFAMTVPVILLSIPAFDTFMAILRRRLTGRGIGEGDRGHIHHRLQERGLSRTETLLVIAGLCIAMASLTIACAVYRAERLSLIACVIMLGFLAAARIFGHHETLLITHRIQRMITSRLTRQSAATAFTWNEAIERLSTHGVTRVELVWLDGPLVSPRPARSWSNGTTGTTWELRVMAPAPNGDRLSLRAFGKPGTTALQQASIYRLLDICCQQWAATTSQTVPHLVGDSTESLAPHIVALTPKTSMDGRQVA